MITGVALPSGDFVVIDESNNAKKFDIGGRLISDEVSITPDMIRNKKPYNAISVLSSGTGVEVAIFRGNEEIEKHNGDSNTVMKLIAKRGFTKRIQTKGTHEGVRYTQMVFLYDINVEMPSLV